MQRTDAHEQLGAKAKYDQEPALPAFECAHAHQTRIGDFAQHAPGHTKYLQAMSMCKYDNVWQTDFATRHMIGIFALQVAAKAAIATKTLFALLADALNPIGLRIAAIL